MPSLDTIRTLTIKATTDGVDDATKSLNDLAAAQGGVAVASDTTTKSTTSAAAALNKLQNALDPSYKSATQLNAAQTTLGRAFDQGLVSVDKYNSLMALASQRFDDAGKKATPFAVALSGVKTQMVALSAGLGPVGTALAAFGPIGLAAGAGLAVIGEALSVIKNQADEAGQWAQTLQQSAAIIGLNTTQIQALNTAAADVGVSANDNVSAFEKFSVALGQLKDGSGTLYTELLKVNPALVSQLSVTKDSATAWNLLAQAYASANAQQQSLITRAAFGRGGAAEGQVLNATANAGGISGLVGNNQADSIAPQQIAQWAQLTTQINSATEAAQHNFQSIFTTDVLTAEKNFSDNMLGISRYAKEFTLSDDWKTFVSFITNPTSQTALGVLANAVLPSGLVAAGSVVSSLFSAGTISNPSKPSLPALPAAPNFDATFSAVDKSNSASATASLGVTSAQASAAVTFLGSAATASDKYDASVAKLNLEVANNANLTSLQGRALAGIALDKNIAEVSLYNSAMGELATTQDLVNAKALSLAKAQQQGAGLTSTQTTAILNLVAANDEWSRVTGQSQIGIFNLAAATKAAGDQFQSWIDKKYLDPSNPTQYAAALQAMANKIQATADAAKVAGSAFPQLAQLGVDAANTNKQFDAFATTSLNDFSDALVSIGTGAASAGAAFQNFGLQVLAALEKMIVQLTIIKPLADAVESSFGGTGGFLSALGFGDANPGTAANPLPGLTADDYAAKGRVYDYSNVIPFARGGAFTNSIVDTPTLFKFAAGTGMMGEAGPEAIVPLKRGSDGSLGIASKGGGNSQPAMTFNYAPVIDASGAASSAVAKLATVVTNDKKNFANNVKAIMAQYYNNNPGAR